MTLKGHVFPQKQQDNILLQGTVGYDKGVGDKGEGGREEGYLVHSNGRREGILEQSPATGARGAGHDLAS